jgi:hypothetical protein
MSSADRFERQIVPIHPDPPTLHMRACLINTIGTKQKQNPTIQQYLLLLLNQLVALIPGPVVIKLIKK